MTFARLPTIVTVALAASQLANAALTKRVTCSTGHVTAHEACCGSYFSNLGTFIILIIDESSFPHRREPSNESLRWCRVRRRGI